MGNQPSQDKPEAATAETPEEPAPRARSFVIGCGIGLIGVILVFGGAITA